jgi:hypothetical protein
MFVGIGMWFKVSRRELTERDRAAMRWWLERKAYGGKTISQIEIQAPWRYDPASTDPLSYRSYWGDGTYQYGSRDGQIRTGGGVIGFIYG